MPVVPQEPLKLDDIAYRGGGEGSTCVDAPEIREWSVGGRTYRTYLSDANAKEFDEVQSFWTKYAEVVTDRPATRKAPSGTSSASASPGTGRARSPRGETAKIREWAISQNFDPPVSALGRIPRRITDAYYHAHSQERPQD